MLLTTSDHERLVRMLKSTTFPQAHGVARAQLTKAVSGAGVVERSAIPPTVVTMNSRVRLIDIKSGVTATYELVYPADANVDRLKISVLAPLGAALLGRSQGEIIEFDAYNGRRQYFIDSVLYQPEAFRSTDTAA
jgi:regulator of nucleoside diphosphate kinase